MAKPFHSIDQLLERVSINPKVLVGKPVIRGTRIPVELIVKMLAQGIAEEEILQEYPRLKPEDIKAALAYASVMLSNEEFIPLVETEATLSSQRSVKSVSGDREGCVYSPHIG